MQNTSEKYPILTAWLGFMVIMSVGALIFSLMLMKASFAANVFLQLVFTILGGFIAFKLVIEHHVLSQFEELLIIDVANKSLAQRFPLQLAWFSFLIVNFITVMLIRWATYSLPYLLVFLVPFILEIFVGYFIFAFAVNRYVVPLYSTTKLK